MAGQTVASGGTDIELREQLRAAVVELERHLATLGAESYSMLLHKPGALDGDPVYNALIAAEVLMQIEIIHRRERLAELEKMWARWEREITAGLLVAEDE